MSQPGIPARQTFLKQSACLMNEDSPSTAAYLLATHNYIQHEQSKPLSAGQQRDSCPACGTIRVPGSTFTVFTKSRRRSKRGGQVTKAAPLGDEPDVVHECTKCHRQVTQLIQRSPRHMQRMKPMKATPISSSLQPAAQPETNATPMNGNSDNASSKKRTKARKQHGLQASLMASKQQLQSRNPPSASLDLLDFLQP